MQLRWLLHLGSELGRCRIWFGARTWLTKSRALCLFFLTLALPKLFYFAEYKILTAVPNYWAHS